MDIENDIAQDTNPRICVWDDKAIAYYSEAHFNKNHIHVFFFAYYLNLFFSSYIIEFIFLFLQILPSSENIT